MWHDNVLARLILKAKFHYFVERKRLRSPRMSVGHGARVHQSKDGLVMIERIEHLTPIGCFEILFSIAQHQVELE